MSRGFLLDTNVPSELTRPQPDPRVAQWLEDKDDDLMYLSVKWSGNPETAPPYSSRKISSGFRPSTG
jgi:hypothetical protein